MNLTVTHLAVLRAVRERLELLNEDEYICFCISDVCRDFCKKEMKLWYNRYFFWRRWNVCLKWTNIEADLCESVNFGIRNSTTFGGWLEKKMYEFSVRVPVEIQNNHLLYKWGRLAWLDRSLETGALQ